MTTSVTNPPPVDPETRWPYRLLERNRVPDWLIRRSIRHLIGQRLAAESAFGPEAAQARLSALVDELRQSPVAIHTEAANAQHYELPPAFFELVLGRHRKYSCCLYPPRSGCWN